MFDVNLSQLKIPLPNDTSVVEVTIKVNGVTIPDTFELVSVNVERCFNRIPFALLRFLDGDVASQSFETSDQDILSPGNQIEIRAGYLPNEATLFKGIIVRHAVKILPNQHPFLEIECKDEAVKMTVGRKNKYFFEVTDQDVIEDIARSHGLKTNIASTSVNHEELVQFHVTDWDFLVLRAEANGQLVLAKDGELVVKQPDFDQSAKFPVVYGTSLFEFEAEMDARDQYPAAKATAWSAENQELVEVEASESGVQSIGGGGFGGALSGIANTAASIGGALGISVPGGKPNLDYSQVMGLKSYDIRHAGNLNQEELEKWAEAQFQKSKLAKKRGRVRFQGIADIYPGETISLQGVGKRHEGAVYLTAIRHEILDGNWYTHAQFGLQHEWFFQTFRDIQNPPGSGLMSGITGLQIGIVTKLAPDPNSENRIQIRLPLVDSQSDGVWARIALQDAGDKRTALFLPEIGDEVIVGFINGDPRDAIVLGAMHSSAKSNPIEVTDENHEKGWITRSEMKMLFNEEQKSITIETPEGKKILINDTDDLMQLEDQHGNKILLNQDGITIESAKDLNIKATGDINIEGVNLTQKAQSNFKAEGQSRSELTSTGEVVVKGSFVRIN